MRLSYGGTSGDNVNALQYVGPVGKPLLSLPPLSVPMANGRIDPIQSPVGSRPYTMVLTTAADQPNMAPIVRAPKQRPDRVAMVIPIPRFTQREISADEGRLY